MEKRSSRGKVKLAHILVSVPANASPEVAATAKQKIEEVCAQLKQAKKPLIIVGKGAAYSQAENEINKPEIKIKESSPGISV